MYTSIQSFLNEWKEESEATLKVFSYLNDESLKKRVANYDRTLGELSWHIVGSIGEMTSNLGLNIISPSEEDPIPPDLKGIIEVYYNSAKSLSEEVKNNFKDDKLQEEIEMYGEKWKVGFTFSAMIKHQIHHRAQMTVLMRQIGLKVPGIYGPSKEEWAEMIQDDDN